MKHLLRRGLCAIEWHAWRPANDDYGHFLRCDHCASECLFYPWTVGPREAALLAGLRRTGPPPSPARKIGRAAGEFALEFLATDGARLAAIVGLILIIVATAH